MRDISKCYKRLKKREDIIEHGDIVNYKHATNFYLDGFSLHCLKYVSEIMLRENIFCKTGEKVWSNNLFRRVKP